MFVAIGVRLEALQRFYRRQGIRQFVRRAAETFRRRVLYAGKRQNESYSAAGAKPVTFGGRLHKNSCRTELCRNFMRNSSCVFEINSDHVLLGEFFRLRNRLSDI